MSGIITLGAGACAIAFGVVQGCSSVGTIIAMKRAQDALGTKLPENPGERVYGTIVCDEQNAKIYEALRDHPVLFGRANVYEKNFRAEPGFGFGKQGPVVTVTDVNESRTYKVPVPKMPKLSSPQGPVTCHGLHVAQWSGCSAQEDTLSPTDADETLSQLGLTTNYDCDGYEITSEWFNTGQKVTIIGDIVKTETGFEVRPPKYLRPYIATSSKGHEYVHNEEGKARMRMGASIGSVGLGLGIWAWLFKR
ncbi:MAG: hypothetical protein S4CHLAM102_07730 [Chlamydiia bacterium]|nr:hypothetical protein [Chlamydiia bacterium]